MRIRNIVLMLLAIATSSVNNRYTPSAILAQAGYPPEGNSINIGRGSPYDADWDSINERVAIGDSEGQVWLYDEGLNEVAEISSEVGLIGNSHIDTVEWSTDGRLLAIDRRANDYSDSVVEIWDSQSSSVLFTIATSVGEAPTKPFSWDMSGTKIAIADQGMNSIEIWDVEEQQLVNVISTIYLIISVEWNPLGTSIAATLGDGNIYFWNPTTSELIGTLPQASRGGAIAWNSTGDRIASVDGNQIAIWDVTSFETLTTLTGHVGSVSGLFWSNNTLLSTGEQETRIWDTNTGQFISVWSEITDISDWDLENRVISLNIPVSVWNLQTGVAISTNHEYRPTISDFTWSFDGKLLATITTDLRYQNTLIIWNTLNGRYVTDMETNSKILDLAWSPSDDSIALLDENRTIRIWNIQTGQLLNTFQGAGNTILWSSNQIENYLAYELADQIAVMDTESGTIVNYFDGELFDTKSSFQGKYLMGLESDNHPRLWNVETAEQVWAGEGDIIYDASISHDGTQIALVSVGKVHIETTSAQSVLNQNIHLNPFEKALVRWHPANNQSIAVSTGPHLETWDPSSGQTQYALEIGENILSLEWDPSGRAIAVQTNLEVVIWHSQQPLASPTELTTLSISDSGVNLNWLDNSPDESAFHIERTTGSEWAEIAILDANEVTYQDENLACGTTYTYRVRAYRADDETYSEYSNNSTATTGVCLIAPEATIATNIPIYEWQDNENFTSFKLHVEDATSVVVMEETYQRQDVCSSGTCTVQSIPLNNGEYSWWVQSDPEDGPSSTPRSFTVDACVITTDALIDEIVNANSSGLPTTFCLLPSGEFLVSQGSSALNALPIITGNITIEGNGATLTRDPSAELFRFFEIAPGGSLTLNNLTLSHGAVDSEGGAILNNGSLIINDSTLEGNFASEHGGAILNNGTLIIANTAFSDNHTNRYAGVGEITLPYGYGGAIENSTGATATINGSTFDGNGSDNGAAIANAGTLTIEASTFTGNLVSSSGGAIYNTGTLTSQSNTLDNNQAGTGPWSGGSGGALANTGTATLSDDNITFNVAKFGGGILNSGSLTLTDTLVNDNSTNSSDGGSSGGGGLLNNGASGSVTITGGEFQRNTAIGRGGGIYNAFSGNTVTIDSAIIADNYATVTGGGPGQVLAYGGGIASYGTLDMTNTRLENNTADTQGGGIHATNVWIVHQSCIVGNSTTSVYISGLSQNPSNSFTNNWWGAANGPSGSGSGSGDSTNLGNRSYIPYLTTGCPLP